MLPPGSHAEYFGWRRHVLLSQAQAFGSDARALLLLELGFRYFALPEILRPNIRATKQGRLF